MNAREPIWNRFDVFRVHARFAAAVYYFILIYAETWCAAHASLYIFARALHAY